MCSRDRLVPSQVAPVLGTLSGHRSRKGGLRDPAGSKGTAHWTFGQPGAAHGGVVSGQPPAAASSACLVRHEEGRRPASPGRGRFKDSGCRGYIWDGGSLQGTDEKGENLARIIPAGRKGNLNVLDPIIQRASHFRRAGYGVHRMLHLLFPVTKDHLES